MASDYQALFLHFFNPELGRIVGRALSDSEISRFTRTCALSTAGCLVAPFGHVHEVSHQSSILLPLTREMVAKGRMTLSGSAVDMSSFVDSRREIYAGMKAQYQNYFSPKFNRVLSESYAASVKLETTSHIKLLISDLSKGSASSNLISSSEVTRIARHTEFLRNEFASPNFAATFSSYLQSPITPQPDESFFLGGISTRLFSQRYKSIHEAAAPTGIFNDSTMEDADYYPYLDYRMNFKIASALGLDRILLEDELLRQFLEFSTHDEIVRYVEMKNSLIASMCSVIARNGKYAPFSFDLFRSDLRNFTFKGLNRGLDLNPTLHAERISAAMSYRAASDRNYARALGDLEEKRLKRIRVGVFTATPLEAEVLKTELLARGFSPLGIASAGAISFMTYGFYDTVHVMHVQSAAGASGVHGSQNVSMEFLNNAKPDLVLSTGICFGVDKKSQNFGDVVVAERFSMYEPGKVTPTTFEFRGEKIPAERQLVSYARARRGQGGLHSFHVGPVLSGEKVVNDVEFRDAIREYDPKAEGGEMECHGIVVSCQSVGVPFGMAKGICDFADKKDDKAHELAAQNSSAFIVDFILERYSTKD